MIEQLYDFYNVGIKTHAKISLVKAEKLMEKWSKHSDRCYIDIARNDKGLAL